jgi:hypothetical protein
MRIGRRSLARNRTAVGRRRDHVLNAIKALNDRLARAFEEYEALRTRLNRGVRARPASSVVELSGRIREQLRQHRRSLSLTSASLGRRRLSPHGLHAGAGPSRASPPVAPPAATLTSWWTRHHTVDSSSRQQRGAGAVRAATGHRSSRATTRPVIAVLSLPMRPRLSAAWLTEGLPQMIDTGSTSPRSTWCQRVARAVIRRAVVRETPC